MASLIFVQFCAVALAYYLYQVRQRLEPHCGNPTAAYLGPQILISVVPRVSHTLEVLTFIVPAPLWKFCTAHRIREFFFPFLATREIPVLGTSPGEPGNIPAPNPCPLDFTLPLQRIHKPLLPFTHFLRSYSDVCMLCVSWVRHIHSEKQTPISTLPWVGGRVPMFHRTPPPRIHTPENTFCLLPSLPELSQSTHRHDPRVPGLNLSEDQPGQTCPSAVWFRPTSGFVTAGSGNSTRLQASLSCK